MPPPPPPPPIFFFPLSNDAEPPGEDRISLVLVTILLALCFPPPPPPPLFLVDLPPFSTQVPSFSAILDDFLPSNLGYLEPKDVWSQLEAASDTLWTYLTGHTQAECRAIVERVAPLVVLPRNHQTGAQR